MCCNSLIEVIVDADPDAVLLQRLNDERISHAALRPHQHHDRHRPTLGVWV